MSNKRGLEKPEAKSLGFFFDFLTRVLSHDCGVFFQFIKYGIIGVASTIIQTAVFYLLASFCLRCLTQDDWAVVYLGLPFAEFSSSEPWYCARGTLAAIDTAFGFVIANIFCWMMNRKFVFKPGKFKWYVEFFMFFGAAAVATLLALGVMKVLIDVFNMMTTLAVIVEVVVSFCVNFFIRKFYIFKR